jgi:hypothetical protein
VQLPVRALHWVRFPKAVHVCGTVGNTRDELHRALKKQGHSGLCRLLQNTRLYKCGHWGQERVGFMSLRLHVGAALSGMRGVSYTEL